MALLRVDRARIIVDLIKDGGVQNEAAYDNVDKAGAPLALKYIDAAIQIMDGETSAAVAAMGSPEKARRYLNILRRLHLSWRKQVEGDSAGTTARVNQEGVVVSEAATEIGTEES